MEGTDAKRLRWAGTGVLVTGVLTLGWAGWIGAANFLTSGQEQPLADREQFPSGTEDTPAAHSPGLQATLPNGSGDPQSTQQVVDPGPQFPVAVAHAPVSEEQIAALLKLPGGNADPHRPDAPDMSAEAHRPDRQRSDLEMPLDLPAVLGEVNGSAIELTARSLASVASAAVRTASAKPAEQENTQPLDRALSKEKWAVLRNPKQTEGNVHFLVGSSEHSLRPGEMERFEAEQSLAVLFHRGDEFGNVRRELTPGVYEFNVTDHGWDLVQVETSSAGQVQ